VYSQYDSTVLGMVKPAAPEIHMHAPSTTVASDGQFADGAGVGIGGLGGLGTGVGGGGEGTGDQFELAHVSCVHERNRGSPDLCEFPHPLMTGVFVHLSP